MAVWLVFGQTVRHRFVNLDDNHYVYENPNVARGATARSTAWAFTHFHSGNWHPLTWLSHMLDCRLFGMEHVGGHHLTNILLHSASAVLLFLTFRRMTGHLWPSAFVATLFAIHPLHVESVAWVSERKDVLSGLFFVLTLAAYKRYVERPKSWARYMLVTVLFGLGLMAKPMLVTLPFVLLLLDYWPLVRFDPSQGGNTTDEASPPGASRTFVRLVVEKTPWIFLAAASCAVTLVAQREAMQPLALLPFSSRVANAAVAYIEYLGQMCWPAALAVLYPLPQGPPPAWKAIAAAAVLVAISATVVTARRTNAWLLVGWFWYLGMLVPVIGLVQVGGQAMADRYTYLPQVGLYIAIAWGIVQAAGTSLARRRVCAMAASLGIATLGAYAWQQASYWKDSTTLWTRTLACTSRNCLAHNGLGIALADRGKHKEAIAQYQEALRIDSSFAEARYNLGVALANCGLIEAACTQYRKALDINPAYAEAHSNLGALLVGQGSFEAAITHCRQAVKINPHPTGAHSNLGAALAGRGQYAEAALQYEKALELNPDLPEACNNLAWIRATHPDPTLRDGAQAVALAQRAVRLAGDNPGPRETLAAAYAEAGRFPEAVSVASEALEVAQRQNQPTVVESIRAEIRLYKTRTPFREAITPLP